ncbi:MAG: hypothetical protein R3E10_18710 [Gemmatimonadota bacterium]
MRRFPLLVLALGLAAPAGLAAQQEAPRAQLEQRVRRAFAERLRRELDLDAEQAGRLRDVMQWSEEQRRAIALENRQIRLDTERFQQQQEGEREASAILEARLRLQEREATLFREEQQRLLEVMSPGQVVRFYELREQFVRRVLQLRQSRTGAARPGRG